MAQAHAGGVPSLSPRQSPRGRPRPRRFPAGPHRRRLPRLGQGALPERPRRQAPERRGVPEVRGAAALCPARPLAGERLRAAEGLDRSAAGRPGRRRRHVPRDQPRPVHDGLQAARRRRPQHAERARRARETARPRPRERTGDQPCRPLGVQGGAGLPHRSLSRQALGAEPDGAALRQRLLRAALAARIDRQHPDHAGRIHRRRNARRLLQPHRRAARHGPEPRAATADDDRHGAAVAQRRRRDSRREAEGAALAQALRCHDRRARRHPAASTRPATSRARR